MRPRLPRLPSVLTGWPRRAAAALCFALALLSALTPGRNAASGGKVAVPAGMVQTSASVYADATSFVHRGDRIDLVEPIEDSGLQSAAPTQSQADSQAAPESAAPPAIVVARNVRVLDIRPSTGLTAQARTAQLLVAAPPDIAAAIAAHQGARILAVTGAPP